jgi:hypothetical protein
MWVAMNSHGVRVQCVEFAIGHLEKCRALGETFPKFTRREKPRKQGRILHLLLKSDKDLTPS